MSSKSLLLDVTWTQCMPQVNCSTRLVHWQQNSCHRKLSLCAEQTAGTRWLIADVNGRSSTCRWYCERWCVCATRRSGDMNESTPLHCQVTTSFRLWLRYGTSRPPHSSTSNNSCIYRCEWLAMRTRSKLLYLQRKQMSGFLTKHE